MSQNNRSIDDILREAQEVLQSVGVDSQGDVKTYSPKKTDAKEQQTAPPAQESEEVKAFEPRGEKAEAQPHPSDEERAKTRAVPQLSSDKTRRAAAGSFFKKNSGDEEYRSTPPQIIEKGATIKSRSGFDSSSDLHEIPTILAVDELSRAGAARGGSAPAQKNGDEEYDSSDQIRLFGFDDEMGEVPDIDEEVAEEQLRRRREEKVNKFRLFVPEEAPGEDGAPGGITRGDYASKNERTRVLARLFNKKTAVQLRMAFTFIIGAALLVLAALSEAGSLPAALNNERSLCITQTVLLAAAELINAELLAHGFNLKKGINYAFPVAVCCLLALAHCICLACGAVALTESMLFPCAAVFCLFSGCVGRYKKFQRIIKNFEFLTSAEEKYTVEEIINEVDAQVISKNILDGKPYIKYSVKADFPTSFFEISFANEPADRIARLLFPIVLGFCAVLFAVYGIAKGDWEAAFGVFTGALVICCPAVTLSALNAALCDASSALEKRGAMVCGFEGAHYIHNSNAVAMDASELFGKTSCAFHGYETFNGAKIDDALLQAAAVVMKTKSPLAQLFGSVIVGGGSILPQVQDVTYEDKLGTSAWIYQRKVLVGTRELLEHHGVSVPPREYEDKYAVKGRHAVYLAVAGRLSAMFLVSYHADERLKKDLKRLEKSSMIVILRSCDPYLNEESITRLFDLPEGFIRVLNASNARSFEKYSGLVAQKSPAYAVHNGSADAFVSTVLGSDKLVGTEKFIGVLASFGSALGFGAAALLAFSGSLSQFGDINALLFQAMWAVFVIIVTKFRKSGI